MGTRTRGNEYKGETYRVRTGSELTGVVSERVLTPITVTNDNDAEFSLMLVEISINTSGFTFIPLLDFS